MDCLLDIPASGCGENFKHLFHLLFLVKELSIIVFHSKVSEVIFFFF